MDHRIRTIRFWLLAALGVLLVATGCELPLLAAYAMSPLGLFMPVFPGGCTTFCNPSFAGQMQLDIAGIGNNTCTTCDDANGTFILDLNPIVSAICTWIYLGSANPCGGGHVLEVWVYKQAFGTHYIVQVVMPDVGGSTDELCISNWLSDEGTTTPDCAAFAMKSIPAYSNTNMACDCSSATMTLTALT